MMHHCLSLLRSKGFIRNYRVSQKTPVKEKLTISLTGIFWDTWQNMLAILVVALFQYVISGCCTGSEDMHICNVNPWYQFYQLYQITTSSNNKICVAISKFIIQSQLHSTMLKPLFRVCLNDSSLINPLIRELGFIVSHILVW